MKSTIIKPTSTNMIIPPTIANNRKNNHGFTLIEVMIAMVIFSIGLLGLAGLQSLGMQNNQTAFFRTVAMQQAVNMADRLRVNQVAARGGAYITDESMPAATDCSTANCNTATMVTSDLFEWKTNIAALLPQGLGTIQTEVVGAVGVPRAVVCVMWNELKIPTASLVVPDCAAGAYNPATNYKYYVVRVFI